MRILSIETSADETAVSVVEATGDFPDAAYEIAGNGLRSQVELHTQYGGIFPAMAKREHAKAIVPLLEVALDEAGLLEGGSHEVTATLASELGEILHREPDLNDTLLTFLESYDQPEFDLIAVTSGPGLEPALWVGVNFAKALARVWNVPVVPVNHMEGHLLASLFDVDRDDRLAEIAFPAVALLVSGGHTELIHMADWGQYEKVGETRDDAVGEAYDKVARLLGLPYPGGPQIEQLAKLARAAKLPAYADLPKPMLHSGDLDFSFSGLKTAVRYAVEGKELTDTDKQAIARDFEDAVTTVLIAKTRTALDTYSARTFVVGGGVSASTYLRNSFNACLLDSHPDVTVYFPMPKLSTDNSIMIALAGHAKAAGAMAPAAAKLLKADGNKTLG